MCPSVSREILTLNFFSLSLLLASTFPLAPPSRFSIGRRGGTYPAPLSSSYIPMPIVFFLIRCKGLLFVALYFYSQLTSICLAANGPDGIQFLAQIENYAIQLRVQLEANFLVRYLSCRVLQCFEIYTTAFAHKLACLRISYHAALGINGK